MNKKLTATEIMNEQIEIPCYLCGKGKITIRRGDINLHSPHPLAQKVNDALQLFLLEKTKEFFNQLKELI
jgi:hypothetical protein